MPSEHVSQDECFSFNDYPHTMCEQVMIGAKENNTPDQNNEDCKFIKERFVELSLFPKIATIDEYSVDSCESGDTPIFTLNIPRGEKRTFASAVENADENDNVCRSIAFSPPRYESTIEKIENLCSW